MSAPSSLLRALSAGTAGVVGQPFLRALARELAGALDARLVYIAETTAERRVLAVWPDAETPTGEPPDVDVPIPGVGHIGIVSPASAALSDEDRQTVAVFAARAGAEIQRVRREEALMRIVQAAEDERRRIGRTLHDGAQQRLVAIGHFLDVARKRLGEDAPEVAPLVEHARDDAREAGRELRELSRGLNPASLTERGLEVALTTLAGNSPLPVHLDSVPEGRLPDPVETAIYYLVAEALANAANHAEAAEVRVRIDERGEEIVAEMTGSGLSAQGDRIAALGGTLSIESAGGAGTRLTVSLPTGPWIS
ncbi:MAG: sensor histidine kinase [Thermoleophilaceae bacterium]